MNEQVEPGTDHGANRDGRAAAAITVLTIALIAFLVSRIV
jgi:hypothetical protein